MKSNPATKNNYLKAIKDMLSLENKSSEMKLEALKTLDDQGVHLHFYLMLVLLSEFESAKYLNDRELQKKDQSTSGMDPLADQQSSILRIINYMINPASGRLSPEESALKEMLLPKLTTSIDSNDLPKQTANPDARIASRTAREMIEPMKNELDGSFNPSMVITSTSDIFNKFKAHLDEIRPGHAINDPRNQADTKEYIALTLTLIAQMSLDQEMDTTKAELRRCYQENWIKPKASPITSITTAATPSPSGETSLLSRNARGPGQKGYGTAAVEQQQEQEQQVIRDMPPARKAASDAKEKAATLFKKLAGTAAALSKSVVNPGDTGEGSQPLLLPKNRSYYGTNPFKPFKEPGTPVPDAGEKSAADRFKDSFMKGTRSIATAIQAIRKPNLHPQAKSTTPTMGKLITPGGSPEPSYGALGDKPFARDDLDAAYQELYGLDLSGTSEESNGYGSPSGS